MEKDKIFFSEQGLTTTSANYVANLAKEAYTLLEQEMQDLTLYTTTVQLLGNAEKTLLHEGLSTTANFEENLNKIAQLKSLIAWLREAIKAKQNLIREAQNSSYSDYGIKTPDSPEKEDAINANDVIATWGIKQRNRYYYLDTLCATIGKFIHPDGTFSNAREMLGKVLKEPRILSGSGRDSILYTRTPSVSVSEVEDTFMHLQTVYRGYQAELNSLKHSIETAVQEDEAKKSLKYQQEYDSWRYNMESCAAQLKVLKDKAVAEAQALKIIIPDSLKGIFEQVSKLGKKD